MPPAQVNTKSSRLNYLKEMGFVRKAEDLNTKLSATNELIGKTMYDLANKTKETNEKLKKLVNN